MHVSDFCYICGKLRIYSALALKYIETIFIYYARLPLYLHWLIKQYNE